MSGDGVRQCAICHKNATEVRLLICARCKVRQYCDQVCQRSDWPTHKRTCKAPNYVLKVTLHPDDIKNPSITRTLSCPASASFQDLHKALQISFGWAFTHLFVFKLKPPGSALTRRFDFSSLPVEDLLRIDEEEEEFYPEGFPLLPSVKASKIRIGEVLANEKHRNAVIEYEYDFGDGWQHEIVVLERKTATDKFSCIAGEGHGAAEDVHGFTGWEELKEAYRAAAPTEEQQELKHWYENDASNKDALGLAGGREWIWDPGTVNAALSRLRL